MTGSIKRIILQEIPRGGPYSQAVVSGDTVYLSGIVGVSKGEETPFAQQWDTIIQRAGTILQSVGSDIRNKTLKTTVYLSDRAYFQELNKAFEETFDREAMPARTTVVCGFTMDEVKVELDIVAST